MATNVGTLSSDEIEIIQELIHVSCFFSILATGFNVFTFVKFKETRREFGSMLIFCLALSDFMFSVFWLPWYRYHSLLCQMQAAGLQYFELSSALWAFCIACTLFLVFYIEREDAGPFMSAFHALSWLGPIPVILLCFGYDLFGNTGANWCWIATPKYRLYIFIPCLALILVNAVMYFLTRRRLSYSPMYTSLRRRMALYLLAESLCQFPGFVNWIQNNIDPGNPIFLLYVFQAIFQPLQGFFHAFVYGILDEHYMARYRKWKFFRRMLNPSINDEDSETEPVVPSTLEFNYDAHHSSKNLNIN